MARSVKKPSKDDTSVIQGFDNVFEDLQLPDAAEALAKAQLAQRIDQIISDRKLTQTEAAKILHIDQPKISALRRGRLEGFSTERLLRFLVALNQDVEITIRERPQKARRQARVVVLQG